MSKQLRKNYRLVLHKRLQDESYEIERDVVKELGFDKDHFTTVGHGLFVADYTNILIDHVLNACLREIWKLNTLSEDQFMELMAQFNDLHHFVELPECAKQYEKLEKL